MFKKKYDENGRLIIDDKPKIGKVFFAIIGLVLILGPILFNVYMKFI